MNIICIDPGKNGGVAIYDAALNKVVAHKIPPTDRELVTLIEGSMGDETEAYLEDLVKFTGSPMPSSAMAAYASSWGFIRGLLVALKIKVTMPTPQKWQKALGLGTSKGISKTEWKNKLKNRAEQLHPHIQVTLATADALLILEAARKGLI
jgi:hypothetical protein